MAKYGTSMGGMEVSNRARRRYAKAMRAEEQRWRSLNGPVTVTKITDRDADTPDTECEEDHQEVEAGPNRLRGAPEAGQDGAAMNVRPLYRV